jgi:hypothetical protein
MHWDYAVTAVLLRPCTMQSVFQCVWPWAGGVCQQGRRAGQFVYEHSPWWVVIFITMYG